MAVKSDQLLVRISPEVKTALAGQAAALGMTMSEYVRLLILEDVRKVLRTPQIAPPE